MSGPEIPPLNNERAGATWPPIPPSNTEPVAPVDSRDAAIRIARVLDARYDSLLGKTASEGVPWGAQRPPQGGSCSEVRLSISGDDPLGKLIEGLETSKGAPMTACGMRIGGLQSALPELRALHGMVGLRSLKRDVVDQIAYYAQGLHKRGGEEDYLHTVIQGPPGTGKTEVARLLGGIFCKLGALPGTGFYKACRSDLVAGYLGQTAIKTRAVIEASLGGVLFIDEAYSLGNTEKVDSFAKECIDTLCEALSAHRGELMVVVAGYKEELEQCFFSYNPGLQSRFVWRYETDKYTPSELGVMFERKVGRGGNWSLEIEGEALGAWFEKHGKALEGFGRDVDALVAKSRIAHARRVFGSGSVTAALTEEDLDGGLELFKRNRAKTEARPPPLAMYT